MAFNTVQTSSTRRRRSAALNPDINITPMVDVMLVLLIIFMVSAPLLTVGVNVDLPKSAASPIRKDEEPLVLTLNAKGALFLGDTAVTENQFLAKMEAITAAKPDSVLYIRADKTLDYGQVMRVMGLINGAGYTKVALITDALSGTP